MAKKTGKKLEREPDKKPQNEPEQKAEIAHPIQWEKIHIKSVLLVLIVLGGMIIIGSILLNVSQSPTLPADTNTTPAVIPKLPADTNTTPAVIPNLPADTNATPAVIPNLPADTNTTLTVIYFYGNGCSACEKIRPLISDIQARYPELSIEMLEVNDNKKNMEKFITMRNQYGLDNTIWAVPTIFIDKNALVGVPEITDHFEEYILAEKQRIATVNSLN